MSSSKPRLLCLDVAKNWTRDATSWSPLQLLAGDKSFFSPSSRLNVKRSTSSRFFMYEEHADMKLKDIDGPTQIIQQSPMELATLLHDTSTGTKESHHYWTSPIADAAPGLLRQIKGYDGIHDDPRLLDPRGPSLWMGSSGSVTQAHYDVADNVIVQVFGTKRIRCFSPKAALALHVFPDAHPRARKSQVNFDSPDHNLFPNFSKLPPPDIDVVLEPGNAMYIPAFWFHHCENGIVPPTEFSSSQKGVDGPSVSLNIFALSKRMKIAQHIFMDSSRLFGNIEPNFDFAVAALHLLSSKTFAGLGMGSQSSDFIRNHLLDTRYSPLKSSGMDLDFRDKRAERILTSSEKDIVSACTSRILPQLMSLREDGDDGVLSLILCHLFELWAVELVGASAVEEVWETILLLDEQL